MANPRLPQKQASELRNKSPELRINKQITRVKKMTKQDLKSMSVDELWSLHELVTLALARKITSEKSQLDHRLRQLGLSESGNAKNPKCIRQRQKAEPRAAPISAGISEIQKPCRTRGNLGG
jgi:hypothetical protein